MEVEGLHYEMFSISSLPPYIGRVRKGFVWEIKLEILHRSATMFIRKC